MEYEALPVRVTAERITRVNGTAPPAGMIPIDQTMVSGINLHLEDGTIFRPSFGMISRMLPKPGDYVVTEEDGYVYLNPKDVFERKYRMLDRTFHRDGG